MWSDFFFMKTFDSTANEILSEVQPSSRDEYDVMFKDFYKDRLSKRDFDFLTYNSKGSEEMVGLKDFKVEKSDGGNMLFQWSEKGNEIYIIGVLTGKGKATRGDIDATHGWMDKMVNFIMDGQHIITSPNQVSIMFVDRLEREVRKRGEKLIRKKIGPDFDFKDGDPLFKWSSLELFIKS